MRITPDTNLLIRLLVRDDEAQAKIAEAEFARAEKVILSIVALCELVWVLGRAYRVPRARIAQGLRDLASIGNVQAPEEALSVGISSLDAGGDFADGVIAHEGFVRGSQAFVSFDARAVRILLAEGGVAREPAG